MDSLRALSVGVSSRNLASPPNAALTSPEQHDSAERKVCEHAVQ